jgi:hypothetical protein
VICFFDSAKAKGEFMTGDEKKTSGLPLAFTISGGASGVSPRYSIEEGTRPSAPRPLDVHPAGRKRPAIAAAPPAPAPRTGAAIHAAGHFHAAVVKAAGAHFQGGLKLMIDLATCDPADAWTIHANYLNEQMTLFCRQSEELSLAAGRFLEAAVSDR